MDRITTNQPELSQERLTALSQRCAEAQSEADLARAAASVLGPACDMTTAVIVSVTSSGRIYAHGAGNNGIDQSSVQVVKQHLADTVEEVLNVQCDASSIDLLMVGNRETTVTPGQRPSIMWSLDLGSIDHPVGLLCLFGSNVTNLDQVKILAIKEAAKDITAAMIRLSKSAADDTQLPRDDDSDESAVVLFELGHFNAIRDVFGRIAARNLTADIMHKIEAELPTGSSIDQLSEDRIIAIIPHGTVPVGFIVEKCIASCRQIEFAEKILVSIRASISMQGRRDTHLAPLSPTVPSHSEIWQTFASSQSGTGQS